ncbi:polyketide synthase [Notoacmeibacter marinus]|uniref:polyketide synthase n=1 Tax=Notoacmeibacter marinus TaxID=1876515 RepID=UPI000DF19417|nr:polyketide synthase [Notoacmeibacter marinus]
MNAMPLEPLAIVAAAHHRPAEMAPFPPHRLARCAPEVARRAANVQARLLGPAPVPASAFRIPPIFERAVSALTLNLLSLTRETISGSAEEAVFRYDPDRTDVIVGVCGGFDATLRNALKVAGVSALSGSDAETIVRKKRLLQTHFGSTTHDKVGEMASIIAARIGLEVGAHGRILALESAEATTFASFETAALGLHSGASDTVFVAIGQRLEGAHMALALADAIGAGIPLIEGASVFVLRRLDDAHRDNDPILAVIDGFASRQSDPSGPDAETRGADLQTLIEALPADRVQAACPASAEALNLPPPEGFGLAHAGAKALANALSSLADGQSATIVGRSLYGRGWAFRLRGPAPWQESALVSADWAASAIREPVAIVGLGASYGPFIGREAVLDAFKVGRDGIGPLSENALPRQTCFDRNKAIPLSSYAEIGGELRPAEQIGVSGGEDVGCATDPCQSLAFAVASEALDQSGLAAGPKSLSPQRWLVVVATQLCTGAERQYSNICHQAELASVLHLAESHTPSPTLPPAGLLPAETARRLSVEFGLNAPGIAVESACASSLAALDIAMRQLQLGLCDAALVVAAELPNNPRDLTLCSAQRMLSSERISPFTEEADGFSPGDGAGAVVLRRLSDAQAGQANILGVIRGIGGSSDAISFTAPDPRGQISAMRRALEDAGIEPATIGYVEAHGTGTVRGDRIEIEALNAVYGEPVRHCAHVHRNGTAAGTGLGSVKSMIGHSFAAAGMAGLIRALCMVETGQIPPTILRGPVHPDLGLERGPWRLSDKPQPWVDGPAPRRAAINTLGTGGTNFHAIVEAPPAQQFSETQCN